MSKKISVDQETYARLEARAKEKGMTVEAYVDELSKFLIEELSTP